MPPILVPSSTKCIARWILVTAKLNKRYCKTLFQEVVFLIWSFPARNYLFNVSCWSTKTRYENCSKLRTKTQKWCQWHRSSVFVVNCVHISCYVLIVGLHSKWPAAHLSFYSFCLLDLKDLFPANIYLFKINNRNTRERCENVQNDQKSVINDVL